MRSMTDILQGMDDSLFEQDTSYAPEEPIVYNPDDSSNADSREYVFQEDIPLTLAKRLLGPGDSYDPKCRYQLITTRDCMCVLKIDDRIPEDAPPICDDNGVIVKGHMVEYPLSLEDDVEDYATMMRSVTSDASMLTGDLNYYRDIYDTKRSIVPFVLAGIFLALGIVGVLLLVLVFYVLR